jgi:hypothetical protein
MQDKIKDAAGKEMLHECAEYYMRINEACERLRDYIKKKECEKSSYEQGKKDGFDLAKEKAKEAVNSVDSFFPDFEFPAKNEVKEYVEVKSAIEAIDSIKL